MKRLTDWLRGKPTDSTPVTPAHGPLFGAKRAAATPRAGASSEAQAPAFKVGDRVRDLGDGRRGVVVRVGRDEVSWRPDKQTTAFRDEVFACLPSALERL